MITCYSDRQIARGSNGTIVFEGDFGGRAVAVKRLLRTPHANLAMNEAQNLLVLDMHPNITRYFTVESDEDFIYLALERCDSNLVDFISKSSAQQLLIDSRGYPSTMLLKLMSDVVSGLSHLHSLNYVHRDLKPQNVLVFEGRSICAKLCDMGLTKLIIPDTTSQHTGGIGSAGWRAPEVLQYDHHTEAMDLFSLGCILFFCITTGKQHPFGKNIYGRDANILKNKKFLRPIQRIPEAHHLISKLLDPTPALRPRPAAVLHHPLFWSPNKRLAFLRDASDCIEGGSLLMKEELEHVAHEIFNMPWKNYLDKKVVDDLTSGRVYDFRSARHLVRAVRNKLNHYGDLTEELQQLFASNPVGFDAYFTKRFPNLVIVVYGFYELLQE